MPIEGKIERTGPESCLDTSTGATFDIRFAGDGWKMPFPLPDPREVSQFDTQLGANFIGLHHLVQLKTAVYLTKLRDDGPELAAKDLADVVELIRKNVSAQPTALPSDRAN